MVKIKNTTESICKKNPLIVLKLDSMAGNFYRHYLSTRGNWQKKSRPVWDELEKRVKSRISKIAEEQGYKECDYRTILKGFYNKPIRETLISYVRTWRKSRDYGSVNPDIAFHNPHTNELRIFEVKFQKDEGNAHERVYKWVVLLPAIKEFLNINYNPTRIVFGGPFSRSEKYIQEFEMAFNNWEEWKNNWAIIDDLNEEKIRNLF